MADGTLRLAYAGALTPLYGLDDVVDARRDPGRASGPSSRVELDLYGRGDMEERAAGARGDERGIADRVVFHGRIAARRGRRLASRAPTSSLSPIRRNRFSEISLSTKVFEGAIMGKPVVAADLPAARAEFEGDMLAWYAPGRSRPTWPGRSCGSWTIPPGAPAVADRAAARARELAWDGEAPRYVAIVEELARDRVSS